MRLLFSLVVENPQLQLAKCSTEVTDYYPYQIKGLSSNFSMEALEYYLRHYQELRSSSRSSECLHALEIVTNGFVHHEVATLIGYVIDFELSFKNKKFQQLPDCLLNMPLEVGLNAIRPHRISDTEMMSASKHQSKELNFDKLKEDKGRSIILNKLYYYLCNSHSYKHSIFSCINFSFLFLTQNDDLKHTVDYS